MRTVALGVTQKQNGERRIDQQDIFHRVVFFLAVRTMGLLSRVLGAHDAPLGAVMGKRGVLSPLCRGYRSRVEVLRSAVSLWQGVGHRDA
jgi:hypothetical protein